MKRLRLCTLVCLSIAACCVPSTLPMHAGTPVISDAPFDPAALESLEAYSVAMAESLERGEMDPIIAGFSPALTSALDAEALRIAFEQTRFAAGPFAGLIGVRSTVDESNTSVDVYVCHAARSLKLRFVHGPEGLEGLWFLFASHSELLEVFGLQPSPPVTGSASLDHPVKVGPLSLRGTLVTPPEGAESLPIAVLLVPGSGPCDMDGTVPGMGLKPLRDLADGLAQRGISSLRFDKRSFAEPDSFASGFITIQAEILEDVSSALELLRAHTETEGYALFLVGHSLGGMLVPEILRENPFLRGAVVMAGSPRPLWDILYDQGAAALKVLGLEEGQVRDALAELQAQRDRAQSMTAETVEEVLGLPGEYVLSLNSLALEEKFRQTSLPLLILQGGKDSQISPERDCAAFERLFQGYENVTFLCYDDLDHFFTGEGMTEGNALPAMDEAVIRDMAQWLWKQQ